MSMSAVTAADYGGSLPLVSISCPDAGEKVKAEDIRAPVAALLAETDDIRSITTGLGTDKVNIAGDTMTDALEITVSSANTPALDATGNGTGSGAVITGGATGSGAVIEAGGGNNPGVSATGAGTGAGLAATGGTTGPGLTAVNGTAQTNTAPTVAAQFAGYIQLTGTDPNAGVNPGAGNVLHGANIPKAWCVFNTSYTIVASYNVDSITTVLGDIKKLTFKRAMADTNYLVHIQQRGSLGGLGEANNNVNVGDFEFVLYKSSDLSTGFVASATHGMILVFGLQ